MIKNRIREYRAKYDMKQEDLAKLVGVRRETIGHLEKGNTTHLWCWHGTLLMFFILRLRKYLPWKNNALIYPHIWFTALKQRFTK